MAQELFVKFIIGGLVMILVTALAQRGGGKLAGLLAGFPAVFFTALTMAGVGMPGSVADRRLEVMVTASLGALVANLVVTWWAPGILKRWRFVLALPILVSLWVVLSGISLWVLPA